MRKRQNIARGTKPAENVGDVGAVPLPIIFERAEKITRRDFVPIAKDDFIGEEDTLEYVA